MSSADSRKHASGNFVIQGSLFHGSFDVDSVPDKKYKCTGSFNDTAPLIPPIKAVLTYDTAEQLTGEFIVLPESRIGSDRIDIVFKRKTKLPLPLPKLHITGAVSTITLESVTGDLTWYP